MSRIIVDCDGVIVDFLGYFIANYKGNKKINPNRYDLGLEGSEVDDFVREQKDLQIPLFPHAKEVINELAKQHEIIIATALVPEKEEDRIRNLEGINYSMLVFKHKNKGKTIIENLKPDLVIDDSPHIISLMQAHGIPCIYPKVSYLNSFFTENAYTDWKDVACKVSNLFKKYA